MMFVGLTQGKVALVDDADYEKVSQFKWYACRRGCNWYASRHLKMVGGKQKLQSLHHFLVPGVKRLDHEDGNGLNNQRKNLRPATCKQNCQNRKKVFGCSSPFKGVCWAADRGLWRAYIYPINRRRIALGQFSDPVKAARTYDVAAKIHFGEFARLNFPKK